MDINCISVVYLLSLLYGAINDISYSKLYFWHNYWNILNCLVCIWAWNLINIANVLSSKIKSVKFSVKIYVRGEIISIQFYSNNSLRIYITVFIYFHWSLKFWVNKALPPPQLIKPISVNAECQTDPLPNAMDHSSQHQVKSIVNAANDSVIG